MKLLSLAPKTKIALFSCAGVAVFGLLFFLSSPAASAGPITNSGFVHGTNGLDAVGTDASQAFGGGSKGPGGNGGNGAAPVIDGNGANGGAGTDISIVAINNVNAGNGVPGNPAPGIGGNGGAGGRGGDISIVGI